MESKGKAPADLPRGWGLALALQESLRRCQLAWAPCVTAAFAKPSQATVAEPSPGTFAGLLQHSCRDLLSQHRHGAGPARDGDPA